MKKILFFSIAFFLLISFSFNADAKDLTGIKIYINPGHGGFDPIKSRNVPTIPFAANDHNGFYESTCNLTKGLELQKLLTGENATIMMSRTQNRDEDNRDLAEIAEEANAFGADAFIAIHSNALGANSGTNYLLGLYKGIEGSESGVPANQISKDMASKSWPYLFDNNLTVWTGGFSKSKICIRDDFHFLGFYLGVLKPLTIPGFLVESSFHDYQPETHRLLNADYAKMTGVELNRFFCDYFKADSPTTGIIIGSVKDSKRVMSNILFKNYVKNSHDQFQPINGAIISLMDNSGKTIKTYTTDNYYNGVYCFRDLVPGTYKIKMEATGYNSQEKTVEVKANETTSFYTLLEDPTYTPPTSTLGIPNIYASGLSANKLNDGEYNISFVLNDNATNVDIIIYQDKKAIKTISCGALSKGKNEISINTAGLPIATLNWSVKASSDPTSNDVPKKFTDSSQNSLIFNRSRGIAVDNNTDSPFFGRIYVTETSGGTVGSRNTQNGLYVLDATLSDVTNQGDASYAGDIAWSSSSSPNRVALAEDGTIYLADWSDSHSGVWKVDPANLNGKFTPIFGGNRDKDGLSSKDGVNIHGSISSCWIDGSKDNTILYTFDEDYADEPVKNKCSILQYSIGNAENPWEKAPTKVIFDNADKLEQNANSVIIPDKLGGWWISQYRFSDSATIPSLIHQNATGAIDFNSGQISTTLIGTSQKGAMAINQDGNILAIGCGDEIKIFDIAYDATNANVPTLTLKYSISPALGTESYGLAFDKADNIYLASDKTGGVGAWALPKDNNVYETPAPITSTLEGKSSVDAVSADNISITMHSSILEIISQKGINNLTIYKTTGSIVYDSKAKGINNISIDTNDWSQGIYLIKVNNKAYKIVK